MAPEIKQLTIDDYDEIIRVWSFAGLPFKPKGRDRRDKIEKEMSNPNCAFFGLFENGRMIALVIANFDGRRGWINRLAVDPERRGKGIGKQLIARAEDFLRGIGAVVICALIEDINYPSISCFQSAGYSVEADIKYFTKRPGPDD